jgi:hypothetical protein
MSKDIYQAGVAGAIITVTKDDQSVVTSTLELGPCLQHLNLTSWLMS